MEIILVDYIGGLKCSEAENDYITLAVDDFFDQWDPSTATLMEDECGLC